MHLELTSRGIDVRLAQVRGSVRDRMRRTGLMTTIGEDHCYLSVEAAVAGTLADAVAEEPGPVAGPS